MTKTAKAKVRAAVQKRKNLIVVDWASTNPRTAQLHLPEHAEVRFMFQDEPVYVPGMPVHDQGNVRAMNMRPSLIGHVLFLGRDVARNFWHDDQSPGEWRKVGTLKYSSCWLPWPCVSEDIAAVLK